MTEPTGFTARLRAVRDRIEAACASCGRDPRDVTLVAVSKTRPASDVRDAFVSGHVEFGENRVQELCGKDRELRDLGDRLRWHMIGSLQTNKARELCGVDRLVLLHSLDRVRLADVLARSCEHAGRRLAVLLQVNATGEDQKHGVAPSGASALAAHVVENCPQLELTGVMGMGPLHGDPRPAFDGVATVLEELRGRLGRPLPVLSLGMSGDLEAAIAAGSTLVRIGTAIFGPR